MIKKLPHFTPRLVIYILLIITLIWIFIWTNPLISDQHSIIIYDRNHRIISQSHTDYGYQSWLPFTDFPAELQKIAVITEDHRFWFHPGIDPIAIVRATLDNIKSGTINSGASTINQQLVRFLVISPYAKSQPTIIRKIREAIMAVRLSGQLSKKQILEYYLNSMYFGYDVYGINTAAYRYFNKPISQLSTAENAFLVGLIANPSAYDPIEYPQSSTNRRNQILKKLFDQKIITSEIYERSLSESIPSQIFDFPIQAPHFVDMVKEELSHLLPNHIQPLIIETTFDLNWYQFALENMERQISDIGDIHQFHNGAVVILENQTNSLLALVGNTNYFDNTHGGQINMTLAPRQPGSALKPFTYATAFNQKILTATSIIDDSPKVYMTQKGYGFIPNNYDGRYRGIVLAREALASSYNLPAVEVLSRIGIPSFLDSMHQFGITTLKEIDKYDYAVTLGGGDVNLYELTNAYAVFARNGQLNPIHFITSIKTESGNILYQYKPVEAQQIIPNTVAYLITDILKDPKARYPTFGGKSPLNTSIETAVKTGTTTDWHDNWTIGYTPEYTVGVWIGNTDQTSMHQITGVTGAGPVWKSIIETLCQNYPCSSFIKPNGLSDRLICTWDGLLAGNTCTESYNEIFINGTEPTEYSPLSKRPSVSTNSLPQIINPKNGTRFEINPFYQPEILFELSHLDQIKSTTWYIDDQPVTSTYSPIAGNFTLSAIVVLNDDQIIHLTPVSFSVSN